MVRLSQPEDRTLRTRPTVLSVAALLALALSHAAHADVTGLASVIDGDTIAVAGERVRLEGIDAPELHQDCTAYGQQWAVGERQPSGCGNI
jgi:endonuclease YncB( thermonuclease family)